MLAAGVNAQQGAAIEVVVEPVREATFVDRVEALGTLQANELVEITTLVTERIEALYFEDGDVVEKGAPLAQLEINEERALLAEAVAVRDNALVEVARIKDVIQRGVATETELALRERELAVAEARILAVRAQIADRTIQAPFAGTVGIRDISVGATVSPGDRIARLADTSIMKLDFSVPSTFLADLRKGTPVEGRSRAYPGALFTGEIATVDSVVDPVTRSVLVRALIPNDDARLRPGLLMTVDLLFNERQALSVDERALVPSGRQTFVFVAEPGPDGQLVAARREVRTGVRRVGSVEIVSGVAAGEQVIIEGTIKLQPGSPIRLTTGSAAAGGGKR